MKLLFRIARAWTAERSENSYKGLFAHLLLSYRRVPIGKGKVKVVRTVLFALFLVVLFTVLPVESASDSVRDVGIIDVMPSWTWNYETFKISALAWCYEGWKIDFAVVAANYGTETETFNATLYYDETPLETQIVTNLAPDEQITLTFVWNTGSAEPCRNYTMKAEAAPVPDEIKLDNNDFTNGIIKVRMLGDSNGDGKVDWKDLFKLAPTYGFCFPHFKYDVKYDFNLNGKIDWKDLLILALNYGNTCLT